MATPWPRCLRSFDRKRCNPRGLHLSSFKKQLGASRELTQALLSLTLDSSWSSSPLGVDDDSLNSLIDLPRAPPISGSLPTPKMITTITRIINHSQPPILGMFNSFLPAKNFYSYYITANHLRQNHPDCRNKSRHYVEMSHNKEVLCHFTLADL